MNNREKLLLALIAYSYNLLNKRIKAENKIVIPINPVSSPKEAKIKSVLASGRNCN
jgi:hypothetical protein